jgi:hypothetical protein
LRRARLHRPGALAGARNAELNEKLQRTVAKRQAWQGVAKSHEAKHQFVTTLQKA